MKKILIIIGMSVIAGAVAYALLHEKDEKNNTVGDKRKKESQQVDLATDSAVSDKSADVSDIDSMREAVASSVAERHEEAAQIMKDAVDIICKRSEVNDDETKELEQISSELDDLLDEV